MKKSVHLESKFIVSKVSGKVIYKIEVPVDSFIYSDHHYAFFEIIFGGVTTVVR